MAQSKTKSVLFILLIFSLLGSLSLMVSRDWGFGASVAAVIYAIFVSIFLLAQIFGFILSQVSYSQSVEQAKFQVLDAEGIPWKKN